MLKVIGIEVIFQLIATSILLFLLSKYLYPTYKSYIKKRQDTINDSINSAVENKKESEILVNSLRDEKEQIVSKKQHIFAKATNEANTKKEEIIDDSKVKARKIIEKANREIELDKSHAQEEISKEVAEFAALIAKKFISSNMSDQDMDKLIEIAIDEVHLESK